MTDEYERLAASVERLASMVEGLAQRTLAVEAVGQAALEAGRRRGTPSRRAANSHLREVR